MTNLTCEGIHRINRFNPYTYGYDNKPFQDRKQAKTLYRILNKKV